jgi:hypothetical protein
MTIYPSVPRAAGEPAAREKRDRDLRPSLAGPPATRSRPVYGDVRRRYPDPDTAS